MMIRSGQVFTHRTVGDAVAELTLFQIITSKRKMQSRVIPQVLCLMRLVSKKSGEYKPVTVYTDPLTGKKIAPDVGWSHNPASGLNDI